MLDFLTEKINELGLLPYISNRYILALIILISFILISYIILYIFKKYLHYLTEKTKTDLDDKILDIISKPLFYFLLLVGIYFSSLPLKLSTDITYYVNNFIKSLIIIIIIFIIIRIVSVLLDHWAYIFTRKTKSILKDILPLTKKFNIIFFSIFGILAVLDVWGINVTGFLTGLGIAGLAIGLALKDSLANIFGGISLVLDKAYKLGDKVKLESGELGVIEDIGLRSTRLKTYDNEVIIIPNGNLANSKILNYAQPNQKLRVHTTYGVKYGTNINKVIKTANKAADKLKDRSKDIEPRTVFLELSDSALMFKTFVWVDDYSVAYSTKLELTENIYRELEKANINIPFPTRTIHIKK